MRLDRFSPRSRSAEWEAGGDGRPARAARWIDSFSHDVPALWPAIFALAGSSAADMRFADIRPSAIARVSAAVFALVLGSVSAVAAAVAASVACKRQSGHAVRDLLILSVSLACFSAASVRSAGWAGMESLAQALSNSGPYEMAVVPLTPAKASTGGKSTFVAQVYDASPLRSSGDDGGGAVGASVVGSTPIPPRGFLVLAVAFKRDAGVIAPGIPLAVAGRFSLASQALNPGDFDERQYLEGQKVFARFECVRIEPCHPSEVPWSSRVVSLALGAVRARVVSAVDGCLPEEEGSVLKALLTGERGAIPDDMSADFRRSGFYRFASVAGFHVDLAFVAIEGLVRRVAKRPSVSRFVAAATVFLYGSISGWTPGAIRAFCCAAMRSFAPALRKRYDGLAGVSAAALVMAFTMPFPLRDVGFQMSFAGSLGGLMASRLVRRARSRGGFFAGDMDDGWAGILRRLAMGSARVAVSFAFLLPIASRGLPEISLAGFVLGGLWAASAAALLPASLPLFLIPAAGALLGWVPFLIIAGIARLSSWVSSLGWACVTVPAFGTLGTVAYYVLLGLGIDSVMHRLQDGVAGWAEDGGALGEEPGGRADGRDGREEWEDHAGRPPHDRIRRAAFAVSCATLFFCAVFRVYLPWPRVVFFAVGQADCALVRYRRTTVLVDTGTSSACESTVLRQLRRLGISRLDACVISHLHDDHAGGLGILSQEVRIGAVLTAVGTAEEVRTLMEGFEDSESGVGQGSARTSGPGLAAKTVGVSVIEVPPDAEVRVGDLTALAFCQEGPVEGADAGNSETLALVITPGQSRIFMEFWGDAPSQSIARAMAGRDELFRSPGAERVIKVAHHGSTDSLLEGFYDRPGIAAAVISVGPNLYGHPSKEVLRSAESAGVRLFRTDAHGAVTVDFVLGFPLVRSFQAGER